MFGACWEVEWRDPEEAVVRRVAYPAIVCS